MSVDVERHVSDCDEPPRDRSISRRHVLAVLGSAGVAGCFAAGGPSDPETATSATTPTDTPTATPTETETATETETEAEPETEADPDRWEAADGSPREANVEVEIVATDLEIPWDAVFAADGSIYLSERDGRVVRTGGGDATEVATPEDVHTVGNAGSLGLALHPEGEDLLYHYYTSRDGGPRRNRVVRYDLAADAPGDAAEVIVDGIPGGVIHNGGDIRFGPEGDLWIPVGDGKQEDRPLDPDSLGGSVLRVTPDGDPTGDAPYVDGGDPRIYTYGHRNPQGVSWLPDGRPVVTEHGPTGRDEVNLLVPGGNYGWPEARDRGGYAGTDFRRPVVNTGPDETWAPSAATFYTGETVPEWRNRLLVPGLRSQRLNVVTLTRPDGDLPPADSATRYDGDWFDGDYVATAHPVLEDELGRIRRVIQGPDDEVYVLTSNRDGRARGSFPKGRDDVLARLTPV